jgi:hypothetical protein
MKTNSSKPDTNHDAGEPKRATTAVAFTPKGTALASLSTTALVGVFNNVNTATFAGRGGGIPMLLFRSREEGAYQFGQRRTNVEEGSRWAVNILTFAWGYIAFDAANKATEHLVPVSQPVPHITELPTGPNWQRACAVNMKCISGADAGQEVAFKANTDGGNKAVMDLIEEVRAQLNSGNHGEKIVPVITLDRDSYTHSQHGRIWIPVLNVVDWVTMAGPASSPPTPTPPEPTPPSSTSTPTASATTESLRRRRVA